jgi:hypothetical protein
MNHGRDTARSQDVFQFLPAEIDLRVLDVFGLVVERTSINPEHGALAVQKAREPLAEAAADAGDEHATGGAHQKMLFLALRPRLSID